METKTTTTTEQASAAYFRVVDSGNNVIEDAVRQVNFDGVSNEDAAAFMRVLFGRDWDNVSDEFSALIEEVKAACEAEAADVVEDLLVKVEGSGTSVLERSIAQDLIEEVGGEYGF
jgi:hypothetical protein